MISFVMESSTKADIQGFLVGIVYGSPIEDYVSALKGWIDTHVL
jgi:hypothetical protein